MTEILNLIAALATIGLGLAGLVAPRYTMGVLDLKEGATRMGLSEIRAASGGLFVGLGAAALLGVPGGYVMMGCAYLGAGIGRFASVALDAPPLPKAAIWGVIELALAAWLILGNF